MIIIIDKIKHNQYYVRFPNGLGIRALLGKVKSRKRKRKKKIYINQRKGA